MPKRAWTEPETKLAKATRTKPPGRGHGWHKGRRTNAARKSETVKPGGGPEHEKLKGGDPGSGVRTDGPLRSSTDSGRTDGQGRKCHRTRRTHGGRGGQALAPEEVGRGRNPQQATGTWCWGGGREVEDGGQALRAI